MGWISSSKNDVEDGIKDLVDDRTTEFVHEKDATNYHPQLRNGIVIGFNA